MQFGFTVFVAEPLASFVAHPFNVYLFPASDSGMKSSLAMDMDTANFHKQHNFDFNKWIYEGIDYAHAQSGSKLVLNESSKPGPPKYKLMTDQDSDSECDSSVEPVDQDISMRTASDNEGTEGVDKGRNLFQTLVDLKVPIIGHSPLIDLLFLYSHFYAPLPGTLPEFKACILKLFPTYLLILPFSVFDTMLLASDTRIQSLHSHGLSCTLEAIYNFFQYAEEVKVRLGINYLEAHYHEAGFDSYVTGKQVLRSFS